MATVNTRSYLSAVATARTLNVTRARFCTINGAEIVYTPDNVARRNVGKVKR